MWILKRLAQMGVSIEDLLLTYTSRIRVHFEQNVALWHFSISKMLIKKLEKVQKACVYLILGKQATPDYLVNLSLLNLEPLVDRREDLCKNFARKTLKHPVHGKMFTLHGERKSKSGRKVVVPKSKTVRYQRSSIPSLASLINTHSI